MSRIDFYSLLPWVPLCRYVFQVWPMVLLTRQITNR
jgi:hypothetical protein